MITQVLIHHIKFTMSTIEVIRKRQHQVHPGLRFQFDYWLLLSVAGLLVIGLLMVYSTTFDYGLRFQDDATYYIRRQFFALLIGGVGLVFVMQFDYHIFRRYSILILSLTLLALLSVLVFGETVQDVRRGITGGSYQPSEAAKLAVILYIAHWLSSKGDRIKQLTYGLLPFSFITGVVCALIVRQPDLSTAGLVALISFTLFFVAGADWRQFAIAGFLGGFIFLVLIAVFPYAADRVDAYTIALRDPEQASWHVQQTLIALGRGGWFGVGIGESVQKFGPLPYVHTDSVFAVIGEELGLIGTLTIIILFGIFVWRGFSIATTARDGYGFLLALGITCWMAYQALINIAVNTAVIPFTGMPLPLISYGGSSMVITLVGIGMLLNISRDAAFMRRVQSTQV